MTAATTALENRLTAFANATPDTELAGLLRWACLHIREQAEALAEAKAEADEEMNARIRLETATHSAAMRVKEALDALAQATPAYIDIARDTSHHVNLMATAHHDPDYGTKQKPQKHIDVRGAAPRKPKKEKP